jgi:hypothetical protein
VAGRFDAISGVQPKEAMLEETNSRMATLAKETRKRKKSRSEVLENSSLIITLWRKP